MKFKTLLLLLFTIYGFSQDYRKLTVRGKVLASLILEDDNYYTGTLGLEYAFKKNHSIGVDFIYLLNQKEFDTSDDVNTGIYQTTKSLAYLVDYRYYFQPGFINETYHKFYLALYYKHTSRELNNDPEVNFLTNDRIWGKYNYNEIGPALGYRASFNPDDDNFGIDISLGLSYRQKNEDYTLYLDENTAPKYVENEKSSKWLPVFRANLYFKFW